jgi:hypothetical protein
MFTAPILLKVLVSIEFQAYFRPPKSAGAHALGACEPAGADLFDTLELWGYH